MLVAGTLLGGALAVGLAAMLLHVGPSPSRTPPASMAATLAAVAAQAPAPAAPPAIDTVAGTGDNVIPGVQVTPETSPASASHDAHAAHTAHTATAAPRHGTAASRAARAATAPAPPSRLPSGDDALTREASLVAGARTALSGGNAEEALRLVRAARAMPSPQLVPEELTVEAQALRSLGKADEARGVDATLHSQFPDSALAR
jgi:hypothetical protein